MPIPSFESANAMESRDVLALLKDRVRLERKRLGYTQAEFALLCGVPLRTFKRFELVGTGSIDVLIRVAQAFGRGAGFDMLFPPQAIALKPRGIDAAMISIRSKLDDGVVKGESKSKMSPKKDDTR
jgi:transcriptional regulator with XRE-family HTH domain